MWEWVKEEAEGAVSNPHRYGQKPWQLRVAHLATRRFQTLIGTVKSAVVFGELPQEVGFQTLIGTVKSTFTGSTSSPYTAFQTLIGTVKRAMFFRPANRRTRFKPS